MMSPEVLEAYGNLTAMATICLVFILSVWLVFKNFSRILDAHEKERERINNAYIEERRVSREDYIKALDKITDSHERVVSKVDRLECIKRIRN